MKTFDTINEIIKTTTQPKVDKLQALAMWNKLSGTKRQEKTEYVYPGRKHTSLNGNEICHIFNNCHGN